MTRIFHWLLMWKMDPICQTSTSILCLYYRPVTVHCSTKDVYTYEITLLALNPWNSSSKEIIERKRKIRNVKKVASTHAKFYENFTKSFLNTKINRMSNITKKYNQRPRCYDTSKSTQSCKLMQLFFAV